MATIDLIMPKMGESIMEATILKWHKAPGDTIEMDESLLDIATDKVDSEVPSTTAGTVDALLFSVNDVVPVGAVIARIRTGAANGGAQGSEKVAAGGVQHSAPSTYQLPVQPTADRPTSQQAPEGQNPPTAHEPAAAGSGARFYSPLVLNIAGQEGVSMSELENMRGTGNEGRVTKRDILQFVSDKKAGKESTSGMTISNTPSTVPAPASNQLQTTADNQVAASSYTGNVEIIEMDRMRRLIADHMVRSKHTSPHVTSFTEADVTNLVMWREKTKTGFEKREGTKITFTPLFIEAIVRCIKKFPLINSSLEGNNIIVKKDINIGMATALPSGNLIVPVIKNADGLNLVGLAKKVNSLADAARTNKLKPDDIADGTFTLTNVGTFGSLMGTPIINQPQVAILAVGAIKKRPVVIETPHGDSIAIRHMMYLSMSYDHRVVDGSLGATFLTAVGRELENFDLNRDY